MSLDHVKVHYNSAQPAQLNALAYAQGTDIHIAPGQEQHLPHEAWHVVQQAQGRVQPTMQMKDGVPVNDDAGLEHEADVMGAKALAPAAQLVQRKLQAKVNNAGSKLLQMMLEKTGIVEGVFQDGRYPDLIFTLDADKTDEWGENVYIVTGKGLKNSARVTNEGELYNNIDNDGATWEPLMEGDEHTVDSYLSKKLDTIAEVYHGERCHECATDMQDAFIKSGGSIVYEIEAESGNPIKVMGSRVRNHYVNVFKGRVYDSSTGGKGVQPEEYMKKLQSENEGDVLKMKEASPYGTQKKVLDKDSKSFDEK